MNDPEGNNELTTHRMTCLRPLSITLLWLGHEYCMPQERLDHGHLPHMLHPGVLMDDDIIHVGGSICIVRPRYPASEVMEGGWCSEQDEQKCNKLVQTL